MRGRLKKEHTWRLRMVLKTELYTNNKITVVGALTVTVLTYSFGIIIGDYKK